MMPFLRALLGKKKKKSIQLTHYPRYKQTPLLQKNEMTQHLSQRNKEGDEELVFFQGWRVEEYECKTVNFSLDNRGLSTKL